MVHFPYDPDSHTRRILGIAEPCNAQIRDLNLPIKDLPGTIGDYKGSEHFEKILAILGREHRRFITRDSDILKHKVELLDLLGISFFDPDVELRDLEAPRR